MKQRKATVITIYPTTQTATITAQDTYEIRRYAKLAESHPHWQLVSAETDKHGRIISVQYSLPACDLRFKAAMTEAELQRKRQAIADARARQKRHTYTRQTQYEGARSVSNVAREEILEQASKNAKKGVKTRILAMKG